jgi:AcrR family transcriptional regulator
MRTQMLKAAETILQASPESDISTRAVCDAVGVGAPVLYRLFGDKNGLLAAVVDYAFERYLSRKRALPLSENPLDDVYAAWDGHVKFALENPAVFRIAYAPSLAEVPAGVEEARQLLVKRLIRCAEAGKLNTTPDDAAQVLMAACLGVEMSLLSQPSTFSHPGVSDRVRDAVLRDLLVTGKASGRDRQPDRLKIVALQMAAMMRATPTPLTSPEVSLMLQWLDTISSAKSSSTPARSSAKGEKTSSRSRGT